MCEPVVTRQGLLDFLFISGLTTFLKREKFSKVLPIFVVKRKLKDGNSKLYLDQ